VIGENSYPAALTVWSQNYSFIKENFLKKRMGIIKRALASFLIALGLSQSVSVEAKPKPKIEDEEEFTPLKKAVLSMVQIATKLGESEERVNKKTNEWEVADGSKNKACSIKEWTYGENSKIGGLTDELARIVTKGKKEEAERERLFTFAKMVSRKVRRLYIESEKVCRTGKL